MGDNPPDQLVAKATYIAGAEFHVLLPKSDKSFHTKE
jgi:hypothetical protein